MIKSSICIILSLFLLITSSWAKEEKTSIPHAIEKNLPLPTYPEEGGEWLNFEVDETTGVSFALSVSDLQVIDDDITRYMVAITSASGVRNIFYEGIRCITQEYKTYAYGNSQKTLHPKSRPTWRAVRSSNKGFMRFRPTLYKYYLCNAVNDKQLSRDFILQNLKDSSYVEHVHIDSFVN